VGTTFLGKEGLPDTLSRAIPTVVARKLWITNIKPFSTIAGVNAAIGHRDMAEVGRSTHEARSFAELKSAVEKGLSNVTRTKTSPLLDLARRVSYWKRTNVVLSVRRSSARHEPEK
jgi:hypothetical protein